MVEGLDKYITESYMVSSLSLTLSGAININFGEQLNLLHLLVFLLFPMAQLKGKIGNR